MKRKLILLKLALALMIGATLVTVPTGCQTPAKTIAYNTLYSVEQSTTAAVDSYLALVVEGKVKKDGVASVSQAYNKFQLGMQIAVQAAQFNWAAPAPADVVALATDVLNAILKAKAL